MAIKIGHASINENNKAKGGKSGDQTGKEVCIRTWYAKEWTCVLRPKTSTLAEKSAKACEKGCSNSKIGYDQNQRNTLYTQAKKVNYDLSKITTPCETDCSAFMTVCAIAGGAKISYGSNAPTTTTMKNIFEKSGSYTVLTDKKYLTSDKYLKRGDILVKSGSHTVMALENGSSVKSTTTTKPSTNKSTSSKKNDNIKVYQKWLNTHFEMDLTVDGDFGNNTKKATIKAWQTLVNIAYRVTIKVDGVYGNKCKEVAKNVVLRKCYNSNFVSILQGLLNANGLICDVDGKFGSGTEEQVKLYQKQNKIKVDGIVGANTWNKLLS